MVTQSRVQTEIPPAQLFADCRNPYREVNTTGEVFDQLILTRDALRECNARMQTLQKWRNSVN
jgi:hypothetical protein